MILHELMKVVSKKLGNQVGVVREATRGHMGTYRPLSPLAGFSSRTCRGSSR
jgi:hypothetical protein